MSGCIACSCLGRDTPSQRDRCVLSMHVGATSSPPPFNTPIPQLPPNVPPITPPSLPPPKPRYTPPPPSLPPPMPRYSPPPPPLGLPVYNASNALLLCYNSGPKPIRFWDVLLPRLNQDPPQFLVCTCKRHLCPTSRPGPQRKCLTYGAWGAKYIAAVSQRRSLAPCRSICQPLRFLFLIQQQRQQQKQSFLLKRHASPSRWCG